MFAFFSPKQRKLNSAAVQDLNCLTNYKQKKKKKLKFTK